MGRGLVGISHAKEKLRRTISPRNGSISTTKNDVPKGHFAVYVGETYRRFVAPISYLNHPLFQDLLHWAEEEFGYNHPIGGLIKGEKCFLSGVSSFLWLDPRPLVEGGLTKSTSL